MINALKQIQDRYKEIRNNKEYLEAIYAEGASKAEKKAIKTLRKVYKKVGFIPRG